MLLHNTRCDTRNGRRKSQKEKQILLLRDKHKFQFSKMEIIKKTLLMLVCSLFTLVLHPLFYTIGIDFYTDSPFIVFHIVLTYIFVGTLIWIWAGKKEWWQQGVSIFACINFVLAIMLMCWINITINDGMTGLMFLSASFFDGCFSIIPIMLCCYLNNKYWRQNNQN